MPDVAQLLKECLQAGDAHRCGKFLESVRRTIAVSVVIASRPFGAAAREVAEDLVQETCLKLCRDNYRAIRGLGDSDSRVILAFVRSVAVTTTLDYFRAQTALKRTGGQFTLSLTSDHCEVAGSSPPESDAEKMILLGQIDRTLRMTSSAETASRDRRIFWLHYRHGLTAKDIAGIGQFGLSIKGVESLLFRMLGTLRKHFQDAKKDIPPEPRLEEGER